MIERRLIKKFIGFLENWEKIEMKYDSIVNYKKETDLIVSRLNRLIRG